MTQLFALSENRELSGPAKNALGVGILFVLALVFFYPLLFDSKVIFYRDFQFVTYPIRYFLAQAYQMGVIPYWTPNTFGGMPFMATLHPGTFYPPSIFLFLDDFTLALNLFYVFHFLVMGCFVFLLARAWKMSWLAALCCGITGMLGGLIVASTLCSNYFLSSVWFPMIFWLYHRFGQRPQVGWFVALVLVIATQTLAACPEISVMTMVILYFHAITFTARTHNKAEYLRITGILLLAVVLALGLTAFQLAPTAALLKHTFRQGGLDYAFHVNWSLAPAKLTTFILTPGYDQYLNTTVKDNFSNFSGLLHTLYMGIFGFLFVFMGFLFRKNREVGFWLVVFLFGLFFALGGYNPLYKLVYHAIPFLGFFRYPEKYIFASSMATLFLMGFGLDALIAATRKRKIKISTVLIFLLLIFGATSALAVYDRHLEPQYPIIFLIVFSVTYVFFYYGKVKRNGFVALLFVMIVMDLFIKGFHLLPMIDRKFYEEKPLLMDIVGGSEGKYRIYTGHVDQTPDPMAYPNGPTRMAGVRAAKQQLYPLQGMVFGIEHAGGIPGLALDIQDHIIWYQFLIQSEPDRRRVILKRSNVKYWVDGDSPTRHAMGGFPIILPDRVKVFHDALPRAFLVPNVRVSGKGNVLFDYYDASFDPTKEVLIRDPVDFQPSPHFKGEISEVAYRPNGLTVKTEQEGKGFLVLLDTYLPGWTVKVDGREQIILRANGLYRAVQLGPGAHTLEFDYFPEGFRTGLIITGVTPLLGLAGYMLWRRRQKSSL